MISRELEHALRERYSNRPDDLATVLANARAWERLKQMADEPSMYALPKAM